MPALSRAILFRVVALGASVALGLIVIEAMIRIVHPCPFYGYEQEPPQREFFRHDEELGWTGRPGAKGVFASRDFRVTVTHDRLGFRNLHPLHMPGRTNILVLGDSFGWGWGVEDHETFAARAPEIDARVNMYSLAAPGYGTGQQLLVLRRVLQQLPRAPDQRPDGVVLLLFYNDLLDVASTERYGYSKPRFILDGGDLRLTNVPVPPPEPSSFDDAGRARRAPRTGMLRRSHAFNLAFNRISAMLWLPVQGESQDGLDLALSARLLREIDAVCTENDLLFHVVILLSGTTTEPWEARLRELAVDLSTAGIAHSYFESAVLPSTDLCIDRHLNARGHELLARHIADVVTDAR